MSRQSLISAEELVTVKDRAKKTLKREHPGFSEVIVDAIQLRLKALAELRASEHLEKKNICGIETYTCADSSTLCVHVAKYDDKSAWIMCPFFGWFEEVYSKGSVKLGCLKKRDRCSWFNK